MFLRNRNSRCLHFVSHHKMKTNTSVYHFYHQFIMKHGPDFTSPLFVFRTHPVFLQLSIIVLCLFFFCIFVQKICRWHETKYSLINKYNISQSNYHNLLPVSLSYLANSGLLLYVNMFLFLFL